MAKKQVPIRHPKSKGFYLRPDESHFGEAARAVFNHAAYTFDNFVRGDDYKWIALACLHQAGVSTDVMRGVASMIGLDLDEGGTP